MKLKGTYKLSFLLSIFFLITVISSPTFGADTTTTEVGAEVEQVIQIAPAGQAPADGLNVSLSHCGRDAVESNSSVNGGGDSVTVGVKPKDNNYETARCVFDNYFGLKTNAEVNITIKADTNFHSTNSDNKYDLVYVGDNPNPEKPISHLRPNIRQINGRLLAGSKTLDLAADGTAQVYVENVAPGTYIDSSDGDGQVSFMFRKTHPADMPAGFYKAKLIWSAVPTP